jgi:hypothetical protein
METETRPKETLRGHPRERRVLHEAGEFMRGLFQTCCNPATEFDF